MARVQFPHGALSKFLNTLFSYFFVSDRFERVFEKLRDRTGYFERLYLVSGDSHFRDVTGNLLAIASLYMKTDDSVVLASLMALNNYFILIEGFDDFRDWETSHRDPFQSIPDSSKSNFVLTCHTRLAA